MLFILKWLLYSIAIFFLILIIALFLLLKFVPAFGAKPSSKEKKSYKKSPNYQSGKFINLQPLRTAYKGPDFIEDSIQDAHLWFGCVSIFHKTTVTHRWTNFRVTVVL